MMRTSVFSPFDKNFDGEWKTKTESPSEEKVEVKTSVGKTEYEIGTYIRDAMLNAGQTLPDGFRKISVTETTDNTIKYGHEHKRYRVNIFTDEGVYWSSSVDVVPDGYVFTPPLDAI